ncbi:hypothetical protein BFP72_02225 [Reichenbachiella sp. 5M10]|uniref:hypothetical protein n=1 Tax=Reichenbachiella sp. 5M10 TaxID=1889772 RepID=UPI000C15AD6A|nr:hypothetical protein [Reichenbachiella sp. 5M10]PIB34325.1 hypothetical protein BFP72_02225 [Reichenbachiella sp. 5M10]
MRKILPNIPLPTLVINCDHTVAQKQIMFGYSPEKYWYSLKIEHTTGTLITLKTPTLISILEQNTEEHSSITLWQNQDGQILFQMSLDGLDEMKNTLCGSSQVLR